MTDGPARTVFLGSGAFAEPSLRQLVDHPDIDLIGVVTAPARPAGRRRVPMPTAIETAAVELSVPAILTPERLRDEKATAAVLELAPDMLVLADFGQIVPPPLLDLPRGALNVHPSLLPRHRGASPIPAAILAGDSETGVTIMQMDRGVDTGPIVAQLSVALDGTENAPEVEWRLAELGADLLARTIGPWIRGDLIARPQDDARATATRTMRREDGLLDPMRPVVDLERQVRALTPWPGTYAQAPSGRLKVWRAAVLPPSPDQSPMTFVDDGADGIAIATPDGRLQLLEVQAEGGRRMSGVEFRRGLQGARGLWTATIGRLPGQRWT